jgi:glycosyltransferase involved in cell wall biosynthesis
MRTKVSVCIPTYNTARYLPFAIDSVLGQEYADFELVICDDASTDNTPEICRGYDDPRLRYVRTAGKSGQGGIFNRCLMEAQGEFVTLLHADDYFLPGFLEDRVSRLVSCPDMDFIFGTVRVVDAEGQTVNESGRWCEDQSFGKGELLEAMLHGCVLCPPSLMIRKTCLEKVGPFRTDLTWGPDWEWDLRLAEQCAGCFTSRVLAAYRVHDASGTAEQLSAAKNGPQERRILLETLARIDQRNGKCRRLRRSALVALSQRHMYFAEQALFGKRANVTRSNLYYAALANPWMLGRPTFWALFVSSYGWSNWYTSYRSLRGFIKS